MPHLQKVYKPLEKQLSYLVNKYDLYLKEPAKMEKLFINKLEMAKTFYNIIISYVRKLRAFNFHEPKEVG